MTEKITLSFKLIIIGDANTGKTAILNQYIYHTFTNTKPTTGIDYFTKIFEIQDFIVNLSIFDTAGQQRYLSMTKSFFRGTNAALFTYSLTQQLNYLILRKQSFLNLPKWMNLFQQQSGPMALKVIVGTKKDLIKIDENKINSNKNFPAKFSKQQKYSPQKNPNKQSQINTQKIRKQSQPQEITQIQKYYMVKDHGVTFSFETSALLNQNIDEVFQEICKYLILKQMNKTPKNSPEKNKQRVQTSFKKRFTKFDEDDKIYLQQKMSQSEPEKKSRSCC